MELVEHVQVIGLFAHRLIGVSPYFLCPDVLQDRFGLLGVIPKISLLCNTFFVFDFYALAIVVKDTSSVPQYGLSSLSTVR